uniref:Zinc knuckle CX2CX4HX4C domain-containing protein n=1 Tax=Chenopodium quinoa TaxID=63459 RepID=A0A803LXS3_CHEQI
MGHEGHVRVHRIGDYFLFECLVQGDLEGLLRQYSTVFDGRIINLRRYHTNLIPRQINFSTARLWVRVYGLPLQFLTEAWARRIFVHIVYLDTLEPITNGRLPERAELRACMVVDLTQPLIPRCFIPVQGDRVIWVYFKYEGVFRFCKTCGCVGHSTSNCNLRSEVAARRLLRRLGAVERDGRNWGLNLTRLEEPEDIPIGNWALFNVNSDSDFNSDDSNDTVYFLGSGSSSDSEVAHDNSMEAIDKEAVRLSPGRRLGVGSDPYAEFTPPNLNFSRSQQRFPHNTSFRMQNNSTRCVSNKFNTKLQLTDAAGFDFSNGESFNFEVGESSSAAVNRGRGDETPQTLFQTLEISEWAFPPPEPVQFNEETSAIGGYPVGFDPDLHQQLIAQIDMSPEQPLETTTEQQQHIVQPHLNIEGNDEGVNSMSYAEFLNHNQLNFVEAERAFSSYDCKQGNVEEDLSDGCQIDVPP